jgi:hypothetical protein
MNGPKATPALSPFDSHLRTLVGAAVGRIRAKTAIKAACRSAFERAFTLLLYHSPLGSRPDEDRGHDLVLSVELASQLSRLADPR